MSTTYTAPSPVAANLAVQVTATSVAAPTKSAVAIVTAVPAPSVTGTFVPNGTVNAAYNQTLQASGGIAPYTWSVQQGSSLPPGLTLNSNGTLTGTPTTLGNSSFVAQVTDSGNPPLTGANNLNISINTGPVSVSTTSLPDATVDTAYSQDLQATGGVPPYTWIVTSGSLPSWLTLQSNGALRGLPGVAGTTNFTVQVADSEAQVLTSSQSLSVKVDAGSSPNVSELKGHYTFLFNGFDDASSSPVVIAGSFTADGAGNITAGVQDENGAGGPVLNVPFTGTYNIASDHRGAFTITTTSGSKTFSCVLGSLKAGVATKGRFIQFDDSTGTNGQRGSGVLRLQDTTVFSLSGIKGAYAFGFTGLDATGKSEVSVGRFDADGAGVIANGLEDVNDDAIVTNSVAFTGSYTAPSSTNGRGTLSIIHSGSAALNLQVYVVSGHELFVLSSDATSTGLTSGLLLSQSSTSFTDASFSGVAVFYSVGVNSSGGQPPTQSNVEIGLLSPDGAGNLTETFDRNVAGFLTLNQTVSGLTYSVASNGRVTWTSGDPFLLYLVDTNKAFLLDQGANPGLGFVEPQSPAPLGGFTNASLSGTFTAGIAAPTVSTNINECGLATLDGVSAFQTTETVSTTTGLIPNELTTGTYSIATNGRGLISHITITIAGFGAWMPLAFLVVWLWFSYRKPQRSKPRPTLAMLCFTVWVAVVPNSCPPPPINELAFYVISPAKAVMIHMQKLDTAPVVAIFEQ